MGKSTSGSKEYFFTHDKAFYKSLFSMLIVVSLQNIVAFSVNMTDNIMLGAYNQEALSGATTVNQIFFLVQQFSMAIGSALIILTSQYWGKEKTQPICILTGIALKFSLALDFIFVFICSLCPAEILHLFTDSKEIVAQGVAYLSLLKWTFIFFIISNTLICMLRSVQTVKIAFYISIISFIVNASINYVLIFGKFGFPEMGVTGSAIGTFIARLLEVIIVVIYLWKFDKKLHLFKHKFFFSSDKKLALDYRKVATPLIICQIFWAISIPMQTAILGHLSDDAIAANSVAITFFQYLKVIVVAFTSVASVMIGNAIGQGDMKKIRSDARSMTFIVVIIGIILAISLFLLRYPLLSMYNLSYEATNLSLNLIIVMSIVMVGMSYQLPVSTGIIQGGGDTQFVMRMNLISIWVIVMPLSFLSAFVWHFPIEWVVLIIQSDQIFKGIPTFIRFRSYRWIRKLAK